MIVVLASARTTIAGYLSAVIYVYELAIIAYILTQWVFTLGLRPSYSRVFDALFQFLRDICEPYLRIFRRIMPTIGPLDISPIIALIVLQVVNSLVVRSLLA